MEELEMKHGSREQPGIQYSREDTKIKQEQPYETEPLVVRNYSNTIIVVEEHHEGRPVFLCFFFKYIFGFF